MSAWTYRCEAARPLKRLFRLVLGPHDGTALAPIPKRSAPVSDVNTALVDRLKALDPMYGPAVRSKKILTRWW